MSALDRFVEDGMRNAERRIPLLAPVRPEDAATITRVARDSVVVGAIDRLTRRATAAVSTSIVVSRGQAALGRLDDSGRRLLAGVVLVVAPLVHVGLVLSQERPPDLLWLIVPGFALAGGLLLVRRA